MPKLDLLSELKTLYSAKPEPALVEVPPLQYLSVDGTGDPNGSAMFQEAVQALFGLSFTLVFWMKKQQPDRQWKVMPLEGQWWAPAANENLTDSDRNNWLWTLQIVQPDFISAEHLDIARAELARKDKATDTVRSARLETLCEGKAAHILHVGPYSEELPTIQRLHAFVVAQGLRLRGKHREIYLGDPRRAAPEKLRTIIRHAVE